MNTNTTHQGHTLFPGGDNPKTSFPRQGPHTSGSRTRTDISIDDCHPAREPDILRNEKNLVNSSNIEMSDSAKQTWQECQRSDLGGRVVSASAERQHPWTIFYFRFAFLISFSITLALSIACLEILYYISHHNEGVGTASESKHYAWTYGPTFGNLEPTELLQS